MKKILNFSVMVRRILPIFLLISLMGGYLPCDDIPHVLASGNNKEIAGDRMPIPDAEENRLVEEKGNEGHHDAFENCGLSIDAIKNPQSSYAPPFLLVANFAIDRIVSPNAIVGYSRPSGQIKTGPEPLGLVMRC